MGWRFQKRLRVIPGITLNLSRKGVSTSIGTRGARVTFGHGQTRGTFGIPGTGLSHTTVVPNKPAQQQEQTGIRWGLLFKIALGFFLFCMITMWVRWH